MVGIGLAAVASISPAPAASPARAGARAYERKGPDEEVAARGLVRVARQGSERGLGTSVRASTAGGTSTAEAGATAENVNLFNGLVTAAAVTTSAIATDGATRLDGEISELAIDGRPIASPERERTYRLGRYGMLVVLETGQTGIAGLHVTLTRSYRGHPAGSEVTVAYSSARARDGASPAVVERERAAARRRALERRAARAERRRQAREARGAARRRRAPRLEALRTARGYAFPVHVGFNYSDDWGAPRRHTGTHEGTDVFAATGTPVLAVTGGRLSRVGTRAIPGNRMWLKSEDGDEFFYGHLSAFAEAARNGAVVEAGDVIGFVGSTGDAEQTPPHLHFEVHPRGGEATNPYPFLRAWQTRRDVPPAAWLERYGSDPGSRPGVLVVINDYLK